jgi:flagellar biogenesis protein FliO
MHGTGAAGANYGDLLVTSLIVLGAVCIAAFLAVRMFGRVMATGRARGRHLLDVVARVPLEPRRSLYVVEVAGKTLLVGTSEMGLSVLSELDGSEVRARVGQQQTFADLVRGAWRRRGGLAGATARARDELSAEPSVPTRGGDDVCAPSRGTSSSLPAASNPTADTDARS